LTRKKDWPATFIAALGEVPNIARAASVAGVSRQACYDRRKANPEFAKAWDVSLSAAVDALEAEAFKRAMKPTHDVLMIFLLKCHRPEVYRDRQVLEHTGKDGEPLEVIVRYATGVPGPSGAA
jgi:hypothetical protein